MLSFTPILAAAAGAGEALATPALQAPNLGGSFLRMCGSLAIVFAVLVGIRWGLKHWQGAALLRKTPKLKVLESKAVGARQALLVVGYNHERMLLASTPQGITLLSRLPEEQEAEIVPMPEQRQGQTPFATALMEVIATRFK